MRKMMLLPLVLAGAAVTTGGWQPLVASITASTALGTVTTVQVAVSNLGQPAASVQVYEALSTPHSPEAPTTGGPLRVALPAEAGPITPELLTAFASAFMELLS